MVKLTASLLTTVFALMYPGFAAAELQWYMKGRLGQVSTEVKLDAQGQPWLFDSVSEDATIWSLGAGVRFSDYLALQLDYTDYNDFSRAYSEPLMGIPEAEPASVSGRIRGAVDATSLSVLGTLPLSDAFSVYGSLGLARWSLQFRDRFHIDHPAFPSRISRRGSDTGTDFQAAFGFVYHLDRYTGFGLEYERFRPEASSGPIKFDMELDTIALTVLLRL